jgi:DMSO/TMAO reductase YedYZ molybdopterin-dependent catalytic subunit
VNEGYWTGVELSYLLQQANVSSGASKVAFLATDGFTTDLTLQTATQDSTILVAYEKDNSSLTGLQLVVPGRWGYKWISDLIQIDLVNYNFLGTEESQGYADDGLASGTGGAIPVAPPDFASTSAQNSTTSTQTSTVTQTPPTPLASASATAPVAASSPKPQTTTAFTAYTITASAIVAAGATVSAVFLVKRKKAKT